VIADLTGLAGLCVASMGGAPDQLANSRLRLANAEDRQMRAMTIEEFSADQAIIDKAHDEIALLERRRA